MISKHTEDSLDFQECLGQSHERFFYAVDSEHELYPSNTIIIDGSLRQLDLVLNLKRGGGGRDSWEDLARDTW